MAKQKPEIDVYRTTDKHNRHDENGKEILNPTPKAPPLNYKPQMSIADQIRQQVRALRDIDMEPETEEEADDFDIDDDPPIPSRWENDLIPSIKETRARRRELEREAAKYAKPPEPKPPTEDLGKKEPAK